MYPIGALLLVAIVVAYGHAQATNGNINGTITDPSGAVIVGSSVTLTNTGTSDTRTTTTNASGLYQFTDLPPGSYRIVAQQQGYQKTVREPIDLQVAGTVQINIALAVGSATEQVVVTSATPLIQAESDSLGAVVDQRETNEMPLNGRNPMSLVALVPSVIPQGQAQQTPTGTNPFGWGNYQIGGGFANQSVTYLDGAPVNTEYINLTALIPTQDSLEEFKVLTNNLPPQYGRLAGGAVQFRTKSGTNRIRGTAYEYLRNKVFNANTFFGNQAHLPNPAFTQNQFGVNIGGPVYLPHLYDGRNRTFFFLNWEGFALRQGITYTQTVPTAAELSGNLSDLNTPIYDPLSTCGVAGGSPCAPGQSQYNRTAFANATIPSNRLNPTSVAYLKAFFPAPNLPGAAPGTPNFTTTGSSGGNNYETVVHLDDNLSSKQHLSARYTNWRNNNLPTVAFNGICEDRCGEKFSTNSFVIADDYTFSPKTLLDIRLSYMRFLYSRAPLANNFDLSSIGQPSSLQGQVEYPGPPVMVITGFDPQGIFSSQGADSTIHNATDDDRISGTLTRYAGNHTLSFGAEFLRATFNYVQNNISSGDYSFSPGFTSQNPISGSGGLGLASFLLGYPSGGSMEIATPLASEQLYPSVYANDDWRATSRLTLHMGLRWEDTQPFTERHNRLSYFDPSAMNPVLAAAGINAPGTIGLVSSNTRSSRFGINNSLVQFSPRVGLAFQARPNTVLSAGYGIFWLPNDVTGLPYTDPIDAFTTGVISSINGGLTPYVTIDNPYPNGLIPPVERGASLQSTLLGSGSSFNSVNDPYAYTQQYNVGLQQQFGNSFMFSIVWGGAKGTHLPFSGLDIDTLPDQDLSMGSALLNNVPNPYYGIISSTYGLGAPTIPAGQLLLPFPEFSSVGIQADNVGNSTYNSMQVTAQQRFAHGASVNASYTWAKLISDTDTLTGWLEPNVAGVQDPRNLKAEKSLSSDDARQRLVVSYVYDLPFGRGMRFLANSPGFVNQVLGGWGVGGVTTLMTGFPLGLTTAQNLTNSFGGGSRPNYVAGCNKNVSGDAVQRMGEWFNTACFAQPAPFTFGDESRNDQTLRAAGVANSDASVYKSFPFTKNEDMNMQFRVEAFNLFNRVQFGDPGLQQGASNFGIVSSQLNNPRLLQFSLRLNY
ncbi:MAG: carboxypeptidase regulatory-like domain-containing protein [Terracidiphilus sp.]